MLGTNYYSKFGDKLLCASTRLSCGWPSVCSPLASHLAIEVEGHMETRSSIAPSEPSNHRISGMMFLWCVQLSHTLELDCFGCQVPMWSAIPTRLRHQAQSCAQSCLGATASQKPKRCLAPGAEAPKCEAPARPMSRVSIPCHKRPPGRSVWHWRDSISLVPHGVSKTCWNHLRCRWMTKPKKSH